MFLGRMMNRFLKAGFPALVLVLFVFGGMPAAGSQENTSSTAPQYYCDDPNRPQDQQCIMADHVDTGQAARPLCREGYHPVSNERGSYCEPDSEQTGGETTTDCIDSDGTYYQSDGSGRCPEGTRHETCDPRPAPAYRGDNDGAENGCVWLLPAQRFEAETTTTQPPKVLGTNVTRPEPNKTWTNGSEVGITTVETGNGDAVMTTTTNVAADSANVATEPVSSSDSGSSTLLILAMIVIVLTLALVAIRQLRRQHKSLH